MTKNEERNILKQIEQLIASAGEDSYIGMAFAGCVQMAQSNIDNDFANNPQEAIQTLRKNLDEAKDTIRRYEDADAHANRIIKQKNEELDELRNQLKAERKKQLPINLYRDLWCNVNNQICKADKEISNTAELLAMCADEPQDIAVTSGLKRLKDLTSSRSANKQLLAALEKYQPKDI